ncbi:MAG TPA: NAD(P)-dependent alcohol dehydrogenase [Myxococcales bacterium]|jgi:NADPH:quinone reductase-like Zn-dependent oxidoreductase
MKMRAMAWQSPGPGQAPALVELEAPEPGPGEVRVRVAWSAANPADLKVTNGEFVGRFLHARVSPLVAGYDFSGAIEKCGAGVTDLASGDEVFGFLPYAGSTRQGAFAEFVTTGRAAVAKKPAGVSHETAAAAATPGLTALQCLRDLGRLPQGGRVMIVGAAGGVGSLAVGVARKLGAKVVAVCSGYSADFVRSLGADEIVDRRTQDPLSVPGPFDVVLDAASAHSFLACRHQLGPAGAYVATLPSPGVFVGKLAALFSSKRCEFISVKSVGKDLELLASWIAEGMMVPVDARFPVREVRAALDKLAKGTVKGRVAVQVEGGF